MYSTETWRRTYEPYIEPLTGPESWSKTGLPPIEPPVIRKRPGRPKKRRNKSNDESLSLPGAGHKMRRVYGDICCSRCGQEGHNIKGCPKTKEEQQKTNEAMAEDEEAAIDAACDIALTNFEASSSQVLTPALFISCSQEYMPNQQCTSPDTPISGPRTMSQTQVEHTLTPRSPDTPVSGVRTRSQTQYGQMGSLLPLDQPHQLWVS
ncbi:Zinc finger, CCHC-type [Sesbania bispinosa]|nr:Zinc finger, CCHC-type [Sesbania bispinosa]